MLCSRCKKRPAVVYYSMNKDVSDAQGLCMVCAKEMGIKPINDLMNKMGISEEDLNTMQDQISGMIAAIPGEETSEQSSSEVDNVPQGDSVSFPFIKGIFSDSPFNGKAYFDNSSEKQSDNPNDSGRRKRSKRRNIDMYCYNLSKKAQMGELDRIIGRDKEIVRIIQILCRRTKNNPCLIGEPGVGKTAIAEGLAIKIAEGNVPMRLKDKEIYLLDLTALVAGTQFRGQFENRIKGLVEEVKREGNIILFIDEVHNLVGAGDSEGSMNAANILKPALSRGEIQVIGATTFTEYRKYIEKDAALERRFQHVKVEEPSIKGAIEVLQGIKPYYEAYHRVMVPDQLITRVVILSERYITDRFLPDKAIDLLDEACACAALRNKEMEEYDRLNYQLTQIQSDEEKILASGQETDYERLAEMRCDEARIKERTEMLKSDALGKSVTEHDLAHVIELWTGIPSSKIQENEFKKLECLEDNLRKRIIGQDKAVSEVAMAIRRSRIQINPKRRPASFIFVGSTGIGKTELVKVLAEELFDNPDALIRLDMSEYMEKHAVSKIIGTPPGYVGYDEAGQITEKVRQKPYSVLLFDEIEKAHPDVMNILLQILDEGKVTDSHGRTVNFENTVIVMTSNAGSDKKVGSLGFGKSENELTREKALKALSEFLRPEFLSRVDEIIVFNKLTEDNLIDIARLMLNEYIITLAEHDVIFKFDDKALELLAKNAIKGTNGARSLRNLIRKEVEDKITLIIVEDGGFNMEGILLTGNEKLELKIIEKNKK